MKLFECLIFTMVILFSGSKNFLILADYSLNRDFYEKLCVNKNKPEMQCHGKCQMRKESNKENLSPNVERFSIDFYQNLPINFNANFKKLIAEKRNKISVFSNIALPEVLFSVPNPPPVS